MYGACNKNRAGLIAFVRTAIGNDEPENRVAASCCIDRAHCGLIGLHGEATGRESWLNRGALGYSAGLQ